MDRACLLILNPQPPPAPAVAQTLAAGRKVVCRTAIISSDPYTYGSKVLVPATFTLDPTLASADYLIQVYKGASVATSRTNSGKRKAQNWPKDSRH